MKTKTELWIKGAFAALIGGLSNSFLAALGISGAQALGIKMDQLSPKQVLISTVVGGAVGLAFYFKQSPVPPSDPS